MSRALVLFLLAALGGCASPSRIASGDTVQALMASQIIPPKPHAATGMDGVAAVAAQARYERSYVTPTAQADSPTFGKK
ncbi:hypothetical protein [Pseudoduganella armeniaca]|jgi:hypothetical protein|uniref:Pilus assembly protein n=1 Tax=Pseudoduganella armeniaca TaxID=2072590 RepID=A0A2R4C4N2_9BURK|nr:hypothetical protein [Pseudoduganella armeniaca]AVR94562.1 hypothetical protein C9I28_01685 [Pseudoduganella armeniaca]